MRVKKHGGLNIHDRPFLYLFLNEQKKLTKHLLHIYLTGNIKIFIAHKTKNKLCTKTEKNVYEHKTKRSYCTQNKQIFIIQKTNKSNLSVIEYLLWTHMNDWSWDVCHST